VAWFAAAPPADGTSAVPGSARHAARSRGSRRWAGCLKWRSTTWLQQVVVWRKGGHAPPGVVALGEDDGSNTGGGGPTGLTRTLKLVAASATPEPPVPALPEHPNTSPPEPSGPRYSARVALTCERGHAPGQVLHALQELRQVIDDRLRDDLGGRYDRHSAQSVGTDKLTVTFTLRAATHADAIRSAGLAAGTLAELLTDNAAAVDLSGVALVVRAQ
jgi:hypothetical protein